MAHMLPADSAFAMLTCCTLCRKAIARAHRGAQELPAYRRGQRGTRFPSIWGSGGSARSGRVRLRPLCAQAVLGAHGAEAPQGMFWGFGARVGPCKLAPLLAMCCMMFMGPVPVETLVTVRNFLPRTRPCAGIELLLIPCRARGE